MTTTASRSARLALLTVAAAAAAVSRAPLVPGAPLAPLLQQHASAITALKTAAPGTTADDAYLLRFVLSHDSHEEQLEALQRVKRWREGEGKTICDAAAQAIAAATADGGWDNGKVVDAAPHSEKIKPFIGAAQIQTIPGSGYLAYVIRASAIDEGKLMASVSEGELAVFFVYAKEVNAQVALARSVATGKLVLFVTANDLSGINLSGGADFRSALSLASKQTASLYPGIAGPTLLLNLPRLLGALVKLFTPLFPQAVLDKLKFEQGPLSQVKDLTGLMRGAGGESPAARETFLRELDALLSP